MILIYQIKTLSLSFIYGIFFSFTLCKSKKILFNNKISFLLNILFMIDHSLLFFILIRFVNNSRLHIYMFPFFILGILFYRYYFTFSNKNKLTSKLK